MGWYLEVVTYGTAWYGTVPHGTATIYGTGVAYRILVAPYGGVQYLPAPYPGTFSMNINDISTQWHTKCARAQEKNGKPCVELIHVRSRDEMCLGCHRGGRKLGYKSVEQRLARKELKRETIKFK